MATKDTCFISPLQNYEKNLPSTQIASSLIEALVKTDKTNGASSPGWMVVGTMVYPFGYGSSTNSHEISLELT